MILKTKSLLILELEPEFFLWVLLFLVVGTNKFRKTHTLKYDPFLLLSYIIGFDIDEDALRIAQKNFEDFEISNFELIQTDLQHVSLRITNQRSPFDSMKPLLNSLPRIQTNNNSNNNGDGSDVEKESVSESESSSETQDYSQEMLRFVTMKHK
jgi:hypothetical protein